MEIKVKLFQLEILGKKLLPDIEIQIFNDERKEIYYHTNSLLPSNHGNRIHMVGTQSEFDAETDLKIDEKSDEICDKLFELFALIKEENEDGDK